MEPDHLNKKNIFYKHKKNKIFTHLKNFVSTLFPTPKKHYFSKNNYVFMWGIKRLYDVEWDMLCRILCGTWLYEVINIFVVFFW